MLCEVIDYCVSSGGRQVDEAAFGDEEGREARVDVGKKRRRREGGVWGIKGSEVERVDVVVR